jgi:hypothetical protein
MEEQKQRAKSDEEIADEVYDRAMAKCYRTDPCDRAEAEAALTHLVAVAGLDKPSRVSWELTPPMRDDVVFWLSSEAERNWVEYYAAAPLIGITDEPEVVAIAQALVRVLDSTHLVIWVASGEVILVERPEIFTVDELGRPHSFGGRPDLMYRDKIGSGTYHWHGIRMPGSVIRKPESITLAMISAERNAERRRVLLALYGEARWLRDTGAVPIDDDQKHGRLYRLGSNELVLVCSDGVPQLDGSSPTYSLRLNAELRPMKRQANGDITYGQPQKLTARNAAASTYGLTGAEYAVTQRT